MWSLCSVSECSLSGRGHGHVSRFLHCGLRKFRHSKSSVYRWYPQHVHGRFVYDTYKTMEATRSPHGWVHMFITHRPTVTLQLHNFDFFRTWRTSSFCTIAWQLERFQLTRRIARSLGGSWASCITWTTLKSRDRFMIDWMIDWSPSLHWDFSLVHWVTNALNVIFGNKLENVT